MDRMKAKSGDEEKMKTKSNEIKGFGAQRPRRPQTKTRKFISHFGIVFCV